jgi:hypothetical protein
MGALSTLSLKSNRLLNKESGEVLAGALKANSVLTELDISSNYDEYNDTFPDGAGFAQALAVGLVDNGAMTSLNLASNNICWGRNFDGIKAISSAIKVLAVILVPF